MDIKKILITGSAGLIGSVLCKQLIKLGVSVIEYDNRLSVNSLNYGNIQNISLLKSLINRCEGVVHLAAVSRVIWGERDPSLCWQVNVKGTENILEAAYHAQHKPWVIYASSREVYGQQTILPVTEDAALMPMNIYARSKVAGENLVHKYKQLGLTTAILRFSSVYGSAHDHVDRVIPAFCKGAVENKCLRIDGFNNLFDFTHVTDVVNGIIKTIHKLQTGTNDLPPIHLTTNQGTSLLQVVNLIEKILKKSIQYQEAPVRSYDVHSFYGNAARARNLLDWKAKVPIAEGIADLIKQYQIQKETIYG